MARELVCGLFSIAIRTVCSLAPEVTGASRAGGAFLIDPVSRRRLSTLRNVSVVGDLLPGNRSWYRRLASTALHLASP